MSSYQYNVVKHSDYQLENCSRITGLSYKGIGIELRRFDHVDDAVTYFLQSGDATHIHVCDHDNLYKRTLRPDEILRIKERIDRQEQEAVGEKRSPQARMASRRLQKRLLEGRQPGSIESLDAHFLQAVHYCFLSVNEFDRWNLSLASHGFEIDSVLTDRDCRLVLRQKETDHEVIIMRAERNTDPNRRVPTRSTGQRFPLVVTEASYATGGWDSRFPVNLAYIMQRTHHRLWFDFFRTHWQCRNAYVGTKKASVVHFQVESSGRTRSTRDYVTVQFGLGVLRHFNEFQL